MWALLDYGIRVVIAPSFADIFFNNCFKNGVLPIVLPADTVGRLFEVVEATPGYRLTIDLPAQQIRLPDDDRLVFEVDAFRKHCLINGLDDIGLTLQHAAEIRAFEDRHREAMPWNFNAQDEKN